MKGFFMAAPLLTLALLATGCGKVGDAPEARTDSAVAQVQTSTGGTPLTIDTSRSRISWVGAKVTASHPGGFRKFDGTVTVDNGAVTGARINIDATSIYTDGPKLEEHLKSDDFFKVGQHPTASFEATSFAPAEAGAPAGTTHMVTGNLTMAGKTNSVTFPAIINVNGNQATAKAEFKINRQNWDIVYPGAPDDLINNDIQIMFDVVAAA